ncbi:pentapeptide repeat-containing protein [Rothia mucilaginosa]|uniref:pentapeptide repeat-containing protein n=1 Tax=Rothia mucilaginosa TaxID=43675 RepID=UPI0026EF0730|nr:pentapeptide repeat-containing protein [Rothia mucilaginosa]
MSLEPSTGAWLLLGACTVLVSGFLLRAYLSKRKQKVPLFYCWLGAIAVLGGAAAFFLPIAVNSGFAKEDDGSALRQALLYTTGGLLGVITLGETHRKNNQEKEKNENDHTRQVYAERRSRYTTAVEQLANEKAAVRLGGIYTLVGLVDEWIADDSLEPDKQQEEGQIIINNLCAYIRSPFPSAEKIEEYEAHKELEELEEKEQENLNAEESLRLKTLQTRFNKPNEYKKPEDITTDYTKLHEEQDVRRAIFEEMSKRSSTVSVDENKKVTVKSGAWSGFKFDFSRAPIFYPLNNLTIEQGQFSSAQFYGNTNFIFAKFTGNADFTGAIFTGNTDFRYTIFNERAYFVDVAFSRTADFSNAVFNRFADFLDADFSGDANFWTATFTGEARFRNATFDRNAYFTRATFNRDSYVYFARAIFTGDAYFIGTTFNGGTRFEGTTFSKYIYFQDATFSGEMTLRGSYFEKYAPTFAEGSDSARFSDQVNWTESNFSVRSESKPIELGSATLGDKTFSIPFGTVVFDPDSWDKETKEYTHMSVTCCRIHRSPQHQE